MNLGFRKRKLNPNESENMWDFGFAKIVGIRQHSDADTNIITSLAYMVKFSTNINLNST